MDLMVLYNNPIINVIAQFVLLFIIIERIWPAVQMIRYVLMPYFFPNEQTIQFKYGSWAVVTGATDGIGKSYAMELAKQNMNLVLISRNENKLLQTAAEIEGKYPVKTRYIVADFSNGNMELFNHIASELSGIQVGVLINNVGINYPYPMLVHELTEAQALQLINVNITSMVMMTKLVLPIMLANHKGAIVNVSSGSELQPWPLMAIYASTKAFVKNYTEALHFEYNTKNITVQCLSPMFTNTKINDFSKRLRESTLLVPSPETYARHAIHTLGKLDHTTGYWPHGVQYFLYSLAPVGFRTFVISLMSRVFQEDYYKQNPQKIQ